MSRSVPEFTRGNYYHIYNRGANKNPIFFEEENYLYLLKKIKKNADNYNISIIAYCLMPNHYHFLLRQDGSKSLRKCIQYTFNSYTKAINKMYNRSGTLFEGPYRAIHIDSQNYLLHLCRYIHRNPVDATLVKNLEDWPYSNYLEWIGKRNGKLFNPEFIKRHFPDVKKYAEFVSECEPKEKMDTFMFK